MQNPFLNKRTYTISYLVIWILITGIHMTVLFYFSHQDLKTSLVDALVFNAIFSILCLAAWYAVRYYDVSRAGLPDVLLYHLTTGSLTVGIWLAGSYFLLMVSLPQFDDYKGFLDGSIPWRIISGIFIYSLIVLIYYLYINAEDRKTRQKREAILQLKIREAEIDRLKAQINPHFLFNSLNSISSLTLSHPEGAREMLVKLSSFLRYALEFRENELTDLKDEIDHIRQYLEIEKVRFGDRLQYDFDVPDHCESCLVPNMILQPLVENAIKHGVYESLEPILITTSITLSDDMLRISIQNSFDPEIPPRKGKGIGLQNVLNRMQLIYQAENLVHINRDVSQFEVVIFVPQNILYR